MERSQWILGLLTGVAMMMVSEASPVGDLYNVDPHRLAEIWEKEHASPPDPGALKHKDLQLRLNALASEFFPIVQLEKIGESVEGREIRMLRLGAGPEKILLWSQMHGDEPTATSALIDLADFLGRHKEEAWVADILRKYTLLCVPMLNPDGAERNQRRNAQGIDINRDARLLQTPEGRILKDVQARERPFLGFNLHNQNSLTTVGNTGKVATIALLAVAADAVVKADAAAQNDQGRLLTKQITAILYEALSPFVYGHISRYDEDYNPRAFGDNLTQWGTPVVLIESGGNPAGQQPSLGVKLNFVGLLSVLDSLASGGYVHANAAVFDALKMNSDNPIFDLILRNAWIFNGNGVPVFKGDIAIRRDKRAGSESDAIIADLGDLSVYSAHESVDCAGTLVTPGLIAWDPDRSLFSEGTPDEQYLKRGISTVLETASWKELARHDPYGDWRTQVRRLNWGYVVDGKPVKGKPEGLLLASWLAAGGRGWIRDGHPPESQSQGIDRIPGWFDVQSMTSEKAARFTLPSTLSGDPASVLPRWTSEAAQEFRMSKRGAIAVGWIADLVLWKVTSGEGRIDLRDCHPSRIIINGRFCDPATPGTEAIGRFIGRP